MTTGTCIPLYCSKAQREGMGLRTSADFCVTPTFAVGTHSLQVYLHCCHTSKIVSFKARSNARLFPFASVIALICTVGAVCGQTMFTLVAPGNIYEHVSSFGLELCPMYWCPSTFHLYFLHWRFSGSWLHPVFWLEALEGLFFLL